MWFWILVGLTALWLVSLADDLWIIHQIKTGKRDLTATTDWCAHMDCFVILQCLGTVVYLGWITYVVSLFVALP